MTAVADRPAELASVVVSDEWFDENTFDRRLTGFLNDLAYPENSAALGLLAVKRIVNPQDYSDYGDLGRALYEQGVEPMSWVYKARTALTTFAAHPDLLRRMFDAQRRIARNHKNSPDTRWSAQRFLDFYRPLISPTRGDAAMGAAVVYHRMACSLDNLAALLTGQRQWDEFKVQHGFAFEATFSKTTPLQVLPEESATSGEYSEELFAGREMVIPAGTALLSARETARRGIHHNGRLRFAWEVGGGNIAFGIVETDRRSRHAQAASAARYVLVSLGAGGGSLTPQEFRDRAEDSVDLMTEPKGKLGFRTTLSSVTGDEWQDVTADYYVAWDDSGELRIGRTAESTIGAVAVQVASVQERVNEGKRHGRRPLAALAARAGFLRRLIPAVMPASSIRPVSN